MDGLLEMLEMPQTTDEYEHLLEVAHRLQVYLEKYNIRMLAVDAAEAGAHRITVSEAARDGRIPAVKIPGSGRWLVPAGAVQAAIDAGKLTTGQKGRHPQFEIIKGTCSHCGNSNIRGTITRSTTSGNLAYKHINFNTGKPCKGSGKPLINVVVTPVEG